MIIIKILINSKYQLYLELALLINKDMYDTNKIPYNIFKATEDELLKKIKSVRLDAS